MAIELDHLTKTYRTRRAVDDLTFTAHSGKVTGFLGPNGAGKSTTMRIVLGLHRPTSGRATIDGRRLADFPNPLREVGALLDTAGAPSRMTAITHLRWLAQAARIPRARADEVLGLVGLDSVAGRHIGSFSLGMRQRLGIAAALLGDPATIILDEPVNGLDPDGIRWIRALMAEMAAEGRTVLVSSHLMGETQQVADRIVVIGQGRLIADRATPDLIASVPGDHVRVHGSDPEALHRVLSNAGACVRREVEDDRVLTVRGLEPRTIGELALTHRIPLQLLAPVAVQLEDVFMELTAAASGHPTGAHR